MVEATVALKYLLDLEFPCKKMSLTQKNVQAFLSLQKKKIGLKYFYTIKINSLEFVLAFLNT